MNNPVDNLIHHYIAGTYDTTGGKLSGLYDEQGNARRGRNSTIQALQNTWSATGAIALSAPFAVAEWLSPEVWNAIATLIKAAK